MARGWESKAVEAQVEAAETQKAAPEPKRATPDDAERKRELDGLELSRKKILHDLENATHPRHRQQLEAALKFLEEKISKLR